MLVSSIITELIRETGGDTDDSALSTLWLSFLTAALRRLPEKVRARAISTSTTKTLSASSRTVDLPTDYAYKKQLWRTTNTGRLPIAIVPDVVFNKYYGTANGTPQFAHELDTTFEFNVPAAETLTIGIDYYKDISADLATTDDIERRFVEPAKDMAKAIYYTDYEEDKSGVGILHATVGQDLLNEIEGRDMEQVVGTHVDDE